ncbi:Rab1-like small GTP-binding protein, related, partial [Eimeria acervulina]
MSSRPRDYREASNCKTNALTYLFIYLFISGQERFRTITSAYYRGADGIVLVYDITEADSFAHVDEWLAEVNRYATENTVKILVGNKSEKDSDRAVDAEDAR